MRSSKNLVVLASPIVVALIIIALLFWISSTSTEKAASQTNTVPVADAGLDQGISVPNTIQLDGSSSSDLDGDPITYSWSFVSIPTGSSAALSDTSAIRPTFDADMLGTYTVQLIVNDGMDDSVPDTVTISTDNIIPVADAGLDQTVLVSDTVQLDGSGSFDDDQDPLTYSWSLVSVPTGSSAVLSDSTIVNPTFDVDIAGEYEVELIVNDGTADSTADTVIISTNNSRPVADAGPDQSVAPNTTVQLDGSGSFDVDSNPLTYNWSIISRPSGSTATLSDPSLVNPTFDVDIPGIYVVQLIVNDGTLDSEPDTVVVSRQNTAPILDPIGDQTIAAGCSTTINLTATDAENDTLTFSATPQPLPANSSLDPNTGEFIFTPSQSQIGDISITFIVSDSEFSDSELITITVTGGSSSLSGRVVDANDAAISVDTPVVGATISILDTCATTTTDASGNFTLNNLPGGLQVFDIDSSTSNTAPDGSTYASFRESLLLVQDSANDIVRPFFLPRIDASSVTTVDPATTTIVDNPNIDVSISIPPNTAMGSNGTEFTGEISISEVPEGFAPAELPEALEPGLLVTIQPVGVTFDTPVPITFPNNDGLAPGSEVDIWSLDPDTGEFSIVGVGVVSADGSVIETVSGGVTADCGRSNCSKSQIISMNIDGSEPEIIRTDDLSVGGPSFSPDGRKIVYSAYYLDDNGNREEGLKLLDLDKVDSKVLIDKGDPNSATFSPDGSMIIFDADLSSGEFLQYLIYTAELDSHNITKVSAYEGISPSYYQDGNRVLFFQRKNRHGGDISTINSDGTGYKIITQTYK